MIAIFLVVLGHTFAFMQVDNQTYARHIVEERFMTRWLIGNPGDSTGGNKPARSFLVKPGLVAPGVSRVCWWGQERSCRWIHSSS